MRVVLVGHCRPDAWMLKAMVERILPGSDIESVQDQETLDQLTAQDDIWLVNRVLDGRFDAGVEGLGLIESRLASHPDARIALISDLEEHQASATALGARAGFGKKQLYADLAADRLKALSGA